jgi:hypothetical protein
MKKSITIIMCFLFFSAKSQTNDSLSIIVDSNFQEFIKADVRGEPKLPNIRPLDGNVFSVKDASRWINALKKYEKSSNFIIRERVFLKYIEMVIESNDSLVRKLLVRQSLRAFNDSIPENKSPFLNKNIQYLILQKFVTMQKVILTTLLEKNC